MAFASFDNKNGGAPMSEINMVPLIDVMLVLLVIFIIAAPVMTNAVKVELPKVSSQVNNLKHEKIEFAIDKAGKLYWNGEVIDRATAQQRFAIESQRQVQPEVHIRADKDVAYHYVAETMADASKVGLSKIGFVSLPED